MISRRLSTFLVFAVCLAVLPVRAQTYTPIHQFAPAFNSSSTGLSTNVDGGNAYAPLVLSGGTLYGTAAGDDASGLGGLFKINTDGTGFTNFLSFSFVNGNMANGGNGVNPFGGLIVSGNVLYGTTRNGGSNFTGTVFAIKTDGTGFTNLHVFRALVSNANADGAYPSAALTLSANALYGTTYSGGSLGVGTVFRLSIDGSGFTNLHNFDGTNGANSDGALAVSGGRLYGTTYSGGAATNGIIFALGTNGIGFTNLHSFSMVGSPFPTNLDGASPHAGLTLSGQTLYGVASLGGTNGYGGGTLFAINTNGTAFTTPFHFNSSGGATPYSDLLLVTNTLYGTCSGGGANYAGTIFKINTDGSGFVDLYDFPAVGYNGSAYTNNTGAEPWGALVMSGSTLYGVTPLGGTGGTGTIYSFALNGSGTVPIPLTVQLANGKVTLSWSNPIFLLQASPAIGAAFTTLSNANSPYIVGPTNTQRLFRLRAN